MADQGARIMDVLLELTPDVTADAEESEQLTRHLRAELHDLDLYTVRVLADGTPPENSKAVDPVTVGAVVLELSASGGVLTSLVGLVQDWLGRQSARHRVSVTIDGDMVELEQATPEERRRLIDAFVRRHGAGGE